MPHFDLAAVLRRIRRSADLSQRELAQTCGVAPAVVSHAEAGRRGLTVELLQRAAGLAGWRLALLDAEGREVAGMADDAVRDLSGRRFPAHLDTRYADEGWWHDADHWTRRQVWYTFDLDRERRDGRRRALGTPADHQLPRPGDAPEQRRAARAREARRRREEELRRRRGAGELPSWPEWTCTCPPECAELDLGERPVHTPECPCGCDVG